MRHAERVQSVVDCRNHARFARIGNLRIVQIEFGEILERGQRAQVLGRNHREVQVHLNDGLAGPFLVAGDLPAELLHEHSGLVLGVVSPRRDGRDEYQRYRRARHQPEHDYSSTADERPANRTLMIPDTVGQVEVSPAFSSHGRRSSSRAGVVGAGFAGVGGAISAAMAAQALVAGVSALILRAVWNEPLWFSV